MFLRKRAGHFALVYTCLCLCMLSSFLVVSFVLISVVFFMAGIYTLHPCHWLVSYGMIFRSFLIVATLPMYMDAPPTQD